MEDAGNDCSGVNMSEAPDFFAWFDDGELQPCPSCGERSGVANPEAGTLVCLVCRYIRYRPRTRRGVRGPGPELLDDPRVAQLYLGGAPS
jgi:hypothetical protein